MSQREGPVEGTLRQKITPFFFCPGPASQLDCGPAAVLSVNLQKLAITACACYLPAAQTGLHKHFIMCSLASLEQPMSSA